MQKVIAEALGDDIRIVDSASTAAEAVKGGLRRCDCEIHVRFRAQGNHRAHVFVGGVDHLEVVGRDRVYPLAIDVKLSVIAHRKPPFAARLWQKSD